MESAIPPHLRVDRSRTRRIPDDYAPPYPGYVARHKPSVKRVVMAYFGVQYPGAVPAAATAALERISAAFSAADVPATGTVHLMSMRPGSPMSFRSRIGMRRLCSMHGLQTMAGTGPPIRGRVRVSAISPKCCGLRWSVTRRCFRGTTGRKELPYWPTA